MEARAVWRRETGEGRTKVQFLIETIFCVYYLSKDSAFRANAPASNPIYFCRHFLRRACLGPRSLSRVATPCTGGDRPAPWLAAISVIRIRYIMEYIYIQLDQIFRPEYLMRIVGLAAATHPGSRQRRERWNGHRAGLRAINVPAARLL